MNFNLLILTVCYYTYVQFLTINIRIKKFVSVCGIRVAGFSLHHGYHTNPATPKLQNTSKQEHTTHVVIQ